MPGRAEAAQEKKEPRPASRGPKSSQMLLNRRPYLPPTPRRRRFLGLSPNSLSLSLYGP